MWGAHSGHCILLPFLMLKNAFKKHPLQNRTNVQIKGEGGSKAFWTMFKKTALFSGDGFPYFLRTFSVLCCTFFVFFHHFSRTFFLFSHILCKIFLKKSNVQFFLLARAIHSEHFLLHCLKKEIATAEELDLRQVGKVLIFRDTQNLPIIYRCSWGSHHNNLLKDSLFGTPSRSSVQSQALPKSTQNSKKWK